MMGGPRYPGRPRPVSELLERLMPELKEMAALSRWQEALDAELGAARAERCKVAGLRAGRLVVEVASAPLFAELSGFERERLRLAINERMKPRQIAKLVFRMGGTAVA
jgi:hypothetical protein